MALPRRRSRRPAKPVAPLFLTCVAAACLTPLFRAGWAPSATSSATSSHGARRLARRHPGVVTARPPALTPDPALAADPALATLATELRLVHERETRARASLDAPPPPLFAALDDRFAHETNANDDDHPAGSSSPPTLQSLLAHRAAATGPGAQKSDCLTTIDNPFSVDDRRVMREITRRVRDRRPWAWIRLADGDLIAADPGEAGDAGSPTRHRLRRAIATWPENENLVVSVGLWWLCRQKFQQKWSRLFSSTTKSYAFHGGVFYLPAGTPDDDDRDAWAAEGIVGWARAAREVGVKIAVVGPRYLKDVPWLADGHGWIDASGAAEDESRVDAVVAACEATSLAAGIEPVLFVFQAGFAAKTIITELAHPSRRTSKDMYVDAGTALDGFAGKGSRAFNQGDVGRRKYCENVVEREGPDATRWVAEDVLREYGCELDREKAREMRDEARRGLAAGRCVAFRRTGGCDPDGAREPDGDASCRDDVASSASGFCECARWPPNERDRWTFEALVELGVMRTPARVGERSCGGDATGDGFCRRRCDEWWDRELERLDEGGREGGEEDAEGKRWRLAANLVRRWKEESDPG